jgi:hypothetical protein
VQVLSKLFFSIATYFNLAKHVSLSAVEDYLNTKVKYTSVIKLLILIF